MLVSNLAKAEETSIWACLEDSSNGFDASENGEYRSTEYKTEQFIFKIEPDKKFDFTYRASSDGIDYLCTGNSVITCITSITASKTVFMPLGVFTLNTNLNIFARFRIGGATLTSYDNVASSVGKCERF